MTWHHATPTRDVLHVHAGCQTPRAVSLASSPPSLPSPSPHESTELDLPVLWAGADIVVVHKPSGWLVHNSAFAGPREDTVVAAARRVIDPGLVPVHRLDRGTSGVLFLARHGAAARAAHEALCAPSSTKRYLALVRGHISATVVVDHALDDDDVAGSPRLPARSVIVPVFSSPVERVSLVTIDLHSGRRHQARRHCKHASHPILGDATHGKGAWNRAMRDRFGLGRLALHCARVCLPALAIDVVAHLPKDLLHPMDALFPTFDVAVGVERALRAELPPA
jgi:tRNA pseudouridine65 synthase